MACAEDLTGSDATMLDLTPESQLEQADLFPEATRTSLPELARISKWLRKEREFSFYGDIDFIPTEQYTREDARGAVGDALHTLEAASRLIGQTDV